MKTVFRRSFARDLKKIKDQSVLDSVMQAIQEVEATNSLSIVNNLKKLSGTTGYFRIRVGAYRIGIALEGDTVEFVR